MLAFAPTKNSLYRRVEDAPNRPLPFAADVTYGAGAKKFFMFRNHDSFWAAYQLILENPNTLISNFYDERCLDGGIPKFPYHYETIEGDRPGFMYFDVDYYQPTSFPFTQFITEFVANFTTFLRETRGVELSPENFKFTVSLDANGAAPWEPGFNGKFSFH
ncbi:hypothetical protein HK102_012498, partial [Quaeritorhiza haematococci]